METLKIIAVSILAAIIYGIIHDQVTARVCIEYFTVAHVKIIESESPTLLGLLWGIIATWWVGLPLGIGLSIAARAGSRQKRTAEELLPSIRNLMIVMFGIALIAGIIGYTTTTQGVFHLVGPYATKIPAEKHAAFLAAAWAHSASYLSGIIGGITLWIITWCRRPKPTPTDL